MRAMPRTVLLLLLLCGTSAVQAASGYYRSPAVHGDRVVFTAEGDLWLAPLSGGLARRLTSHPAEESQVAISPDGRLLAFVAAYDGVPDVYAMPLAGGEPRRLSFDGGRVFVQGFHPDGSVVYATENVIGPTLSRVLRAVDTTTGATREIALADANEGSFDADGETLWFTRFGLHMSADNARDYRGGAMAQVWRWAVDGNAEAQRIAADLDANLSRPMWWNGRLYALSDASGAANLWSMAPDGSDRRALTRHSEFEVRSPSLGDGRIVYQHGADLRVFDLASAQDRLIPITLGSDFEQRRERFLRRPLAYLGSVALSHAGDRVAVAARGRAALAGVGPLRRIEIATPTTARVRQPLLSRDGKHVHAIVDQDGRSEIWRFPADGAAGGTALTRDGQVHRWRLYPSPDGRWLAHDDKLGRLWLLDLRDGSNRMVDESEYARDDAYQSVVWSLDSRYLAAARPDTTRQRNQIVLIALTGSKTAVLSSDRYDSHAPQFSRDGEWLYFLSDRTFQPPASGPWGDRNTGAGFDRRTRVYALALQAGLRFPFQPRDELQAAIADAPPTSSGDAAKAPSKTPPELPAVDFEGLAARLYEVPLVAGNYSALALDAQRLYLLDRDAAPDAKPVLKTLAISTEAPQPEVFSADVQSFALSADARKLLLVKPGTDPAAPQVPGEILIVDAGAKAPADVSKLQVRLADWNLAIDPAAEWRQMFDDAWRMHRQFSFDPAMRGQDWNAVRNRYAPLLARVNDRAELDDLLAQMSAEHGILHSQVRGGEMRADPEAVAAAALGATYTPRADGARIERIYRTEAELPSERGPLEPPGVDVREGDVLQAIDGKPVRHAGDIANALRQRAGQQVLLTVRRADAAARKVVVVPVALDRDAQLRYGDWVQATRAKVEVAGNGRIGYLHLRAMVGADMASFVREFYANYDREGLIIDVRRNRGGNIDSWVIEKLLRRGWAFWQPPRGAPYWNMQQTFRGHLVVLADPFTYSDGETFAAGIKALGLGPVIGMRTAGAGIWLSDRNRLADNGVARVAEFGQFDREGRWLIEGRGVAPDIEVDNLPQATARGADAQLSAALAYLERKLAEQPIAPARAQPIPPRGTPGHDGSR